MVVVFEVGAWDAEEGLAGDEFEEETTEAPDIEGLVDSIAEDELGGSEAEGCDDFGRRIGEEVCCFGVRPNLPSMRSAMFLLTASHIGQFDLEVAGEPCEGDERLCNAKITRRPSILFAIQSLNWR